MNGYVQASVCKVAQKTQLTSVRKVAVFTGDLSEN
jgi:hypothetical protein